MPWLGSSGPVGRGRAAGCARAVRAGLAQLLEGGFLHLHPSRLAAGGGSQRHHALRTPGRRPCR
eukprot:11161946-Lingulodinium_polyedra.AAC.1